MSEANGQTMPLGWCQSEIGSVLSFNYGKGLPAEVRKPGDTPVYGSNGRVGFHDRQLISGPAVIIGRKGSVGEVHFEQGPCWPIDTTYFVDDFHGMHPRFVYYQLSCLGLGRFEKSTAIPGISRTDVYNKGFVLCSRNEQIRIADTIDELLSDLDAGVAALERVRAKLKLYRAAVLKAAVEGTLTAEWRAQHPQTEPASEFLKRILVERRRRWGDEQIRKFKKKGQEPPQHWKTKYKEPVASNTSNIPPLPEGWCWASLDQVFQVERGRFSVRPRNDPRYYGGTVPFVQIGNLPREGGAIRSYDKTLNAAGLAVSKKFSSGTVLIAIVGATIGNTGILSFDSCCPDSLVALQCSSPVLLRFAEIVLRSKKLWLRTLASASGGQPNINLELLQPLPIPLPPLSEVEAVVESAEDQLSIIEHLEADLETKLKSAQALRQSILRHAFTGQLVPQDMNDEPASELLRRIAAEREARAREATAAKRANKNNNGPHASQRGRQKKNPTKDD